MITNLLQEIRDLLSGLEGLSESLASIIAAIQTQAEALEAIEENTESLDGIANSTEAIKDDVGNIDDNLATVLSRLTNLLNNVVAINNTSTSEAADVAIVKNYLATMTPDVSSSADFAEQIATNTLEIKNHQVSLDADSTEQIALLRRIITRLDDIYNEMSNGGTP